MASAPAAVADVLERWTGLEWWSYADVEEVQAYGQRLTILNDDRSPDNQALEAYGLANYSVPPGGLAVDVGGHVGKVAILLAKLNPGARVVTFEPSELNRFFLEMNLAINQVPFRPSGSGDLLLPAGASLAAARSGAGVVEVRAEAIAGSTGTQDFAFVPSSADSSSLDAVHRSSLLAQYSLVDTLSLEEALAGIGAEKVHLLKLDCEGCEFHAVPSLQNATLDRLLRVVGEYHDGVEHRESIVAVHRVREVACSRDWDLRRTSSGQRLAC